MFTFYVFWQGKTIPSGYTDPLLALKPVNVVTKVTDLAGMYCANTTTKYKSIGLH